MQDNTDVIQYEDTTGHMLWIIPDLISSTGGPKMEIEDGDKLPHVYVMQERWRSGNTMVDNTIGWFVMSLVSRKSCKKDGVRQHHG